jgi:hypothetical protein
MKNLNSLQTPPPSSLLVCIVSNFCFKHHEDLRKPLTLPPSPPV